MILYPSIVSIAEYRPFSLSLNPVCSYVCVCVCSFLRSFFGLVYVLFLALLLVRCDERSTSVNIILFRLYIVRCLFSFYYLSRSFFLRSNF